MKADFSRVTFDETNHYSGVLYQQGRVLTDADFNEAQEIGKHRNETTTAHVIGPAGTPKFDAINGQTLPNGGFALDVNGDGELTIGPGHYYVDGILCVNEAEAPYDLQPYLPEPPAILESLEEAGAVVGLVYLDVFERERTALDDPDLREGVLGGPDTTARSEVVWQVKVLPLSSVALSDAAVSGLSAQADTVRTLRQNLADAATEDERQSIRRNLRAALRTLAADAAAAGIDCELSPQEWTDLSAPRSPQMAVDTPPVSPDDGPCDAPPDADFLGPENQLYRVEVHTTGAGGSRSSSRFKWSRENGSVVAKIERVGASTGGVVSGNVLGVHSTGRDSYLGFHNGDWVEYIDDLLEMNTGAGTLRQIVADPENNEITLSSNVAVRFDHNPKLRRWDQGAQTSTRNGGTGTVANNADGVPMNTADDSWLLLEYNVWVQFADEVYQPGDYWIMAARAATGTVDFAAGFQPAHGVEHHYAKLGYVLINAAGALQVALDCRPLFPPLTDLRAEDVTFDNSLCQMPDTVTVQDAIEQLCQRSGGGGCCTCIGEGGEFQRLDEAINELLGRGEQALCLCLLPGIHEMEAMGDLIERLNLLNRADRLDITIHGCGEASRIRLGPPTIFNGLRSITLRDLAIDFAAEVNDEAGLIFRQCAAVTIEHCHGWGNAIEGPLVLIDRCGRVLMADCTWEAIGPSTFRPIREFLVQFREEVFAAFLQEDVPPPSLRRTALKVAAQLREDINSRRMLVTALRRLTAANNMRRIMNTKERNAYLNLSDAMSDQALEALEIEGLADLLIDVRRWIIIARPGVALAVDTPTVAWDREMRRARAVKQAKNETHIRSNQIDGVLLFYGTQPFDFPTDSDDLGTLSGQMRSSIKNAPPLTRAGGTLHVADNRLANFTVSARFMEEMRMFAETASQTDQAQMLFREVRVQGNVIEVARNMLVGGRISVVDNFFTEPLFAEGDNFSQERLAVFVAESGLLVGNQGEGTQEVGLSMVMLSTSRQEMGNLGIDIL